MIETIGKALFGMAAGLGIASLSVRLASRKRAHEKLGLALGLGVPLLAISGKLLEDVGNGRFMSASAQPTGKYAASYGMKHQPTLKSAFDRDQQQRQVTSQANYAMR